MALVHRHTCYSSLQMSFGQCLVCNPGRLVAVYILFFLELQRVDSHLTEIEVPACQVAGLYFSGAFSCFRMLPCVLAP